MDATFNTFNWIQIHQKQRMQWNLFFFFWNMFSFSLVTHMHRLSLFVYHEALWLGEVGDAEGTMPSGEHFSPRKGWVPLPLSHPASSFIIYRRDKIKQTQQNGVKSENGGSHVSYMERVAGDAHGAEFVQFLFLPPSIPLQAAVRWKLSIKENNNATHCVCVRRAGCNINGVISQVIKAKFTLNALRLFLHLKVPWLTYSY